MTIHFGDSTSIATATGLGAKMGQVLQDVKTNTASRIATSFAGLVGVTITPASANSKFLVSYKCSMSTANGGYSGRVRLVRITGGSTTAIYIGDASGSRSQCSCLLYTSPSPRDKRQSRMPSSA